MEYNNFEKHIAETLRHDEVNLDINALIKEIHDVKSRRRFPFWVWFSTALVAAGFVASFLYFKGEKNNSEIVNQYQKVEINLNKTTSLIPATNDKSAKNGSQVTTDELGVKEEIKNNNKVGFDKLLGHQNNSGSDKDMPKAKWTYAKKKIYSNTISKLTTSTNVLIGTSQEHEKMDWVDEINTNRSNEGIVLSPMDFKVQELHSGHYGKIKSGNINCPTFNKKGKYFFEIIPEIGYFRPIKKLEQNVNEPDNIFALRRNNETTLEGLNAGLYLRMGREKLPFFFQIGTSVSRMTEKMPLDYSYIRRDTTRGIISITQSQTGDTLTVIFGDIVQETKVSGKKTNHHHFTLIDFPLSAGYEKRMGQWAAGIEAGVVLNMSLKASGQILASDTSFTAIDAPVQAYRSRLAMSYFGGLYLSRDFYEAGRFFVSLRGRYIPGAFSTDQNRIRQSYHFLGLNLGYIYSF